MASESPTIAITSPQFVKIFKQFDKNDTGNIDTDDLEQFLSKFEEKGLLEHTRAVEIAEKIKEEQVEGTDIHMTKLLKELMPENFLQIEFGERRERITSVEFMKLWNNYDVDRSGYLDVAELMKFFYDMLTKTSTSENPDDLEEKVDLYVKVMHEMARINGDRVYLEDMCKFCPVEENYLEQFEILSEEDFEAVFAHYDQDKSNEIDGCELEGFLKDLYDKKHKPGQSFEKFKTEKLKKFDKNKDKKFSKGEVKAILYKS